MRSLSIYNRVRLPFHQTALTIACTLLFSGHALSSRTTSQEAIPIARAGACTDYYQLVNHRWLALPMWPINSDIFSGVVAQSEATLSLALDSARQRPPNNVTLHKLLNLYTSYHDQDSKEQLGWAPLAPEFALIDSLNTADQLPEILAKLYRSGIAGPLGLRVILEEDNEEYTAQINFSNNVFQHQARPSTQHIARTFRLIGATENDAQNAADTILRMNGPLPNPLPQVDVAFNMTRFKQQLGIPGDKKVAVSDQTRRRIAYFTSYYSVNEWKYYLRWLAIQAFTPYLPHMQEQDAWNGLSKQRPRFPAVDFLQNMMSDALHQFYLQHVLRPEIVNEVEDMVTRLRQTLQQRITTRSWLTEPSRRVAIQRLNAMRILLARPERWVDYTDLTIEPNTLIANIKQLANFKLTRQISLIGEAEELGRMSQATWKRADALYYRPNSNTVVIGPMVLQSPVISTLTPINHPRNLDYNYGALGTIIAHEMLHGLDIIDQRRPADIPLGLIQLQQPQEIAYANTMVDRQIRYSTALYQQHKTEYAWNIIEDIPDLGSVPLALAALSARRNIHAIDAASADRFFWGFASIFRQKIKEGWVSPGIRVNGTLANVPEFAKTYACVAGDKMVRTESERIRLW